jgi:hypothetical protein
MPVAFALELMTRNLAANILRSLWPEAHVDRVGGSGVICSRPTICLKVRSNQSIF